MVAAARRMAAVIGLTAAGLALAACSAGGDTTAAASGSAYGISPQRVLPAPRSMQAATGLQANGVMWALTGPDSAGLFEISAATGQVNKLLGQ